MKLINADLFDEATTERAVVQFSATWCGPCKNLTRTVEAHEKSLGIPFYKVDLDDDRELASKYNVKSVPTIILFKDGKEINRLIGDQTLSKLQAFVGA
jgi:thioredoxin 1